MDEELKAKWIEALRSKKYHQCRYDLHNPEEGAHCCLGILCVVAGIDFDYFKLNSVLPEKKQEVFIKLNDDHKMSFKKIAKYIEARKLSI